MRRGDGTCPAGTPEEACAARSAARFGRAAG